MKKTKNRKIAPQEIVLYSLAGILSVWGIVEIVLGLICEFANVRVNEFPLIVAQNTYISLFGMSFLHWGLVLLTIGVVFGVIVLCIYAARYDREVEKASRRAARIAMMHENLDQNSKEQ